MQAELTAVRKAEKEAQWTRGGYNSPEYAEYAKEPRAKGASVRKQLADGGMFAGLMSIVIREFDNEQRRFYSYGK